ncbi:MAG: hypothetical protein HYY17_03630 [Planctomycetes bacterium]|nr:hypothetical protein [Planctomycetota bacterium]
MEKTEGNEPVETKKVLEAESYTVMSLCDELSSAEDDVMWSDGSCCACPSYTTVPCSC